MKKLILLLAAVALATSVWAQDTPKKPSFAGFVSNGFWDNWEITLGGGAGTALLKKWSCQQPQEYHRCSSMHHVKWESRHI